MSLDISGVAVESVWNKTKQNKRPEFLKKRERNQDRKVNESTSICEVIDTFHTLRRGFL